MHPPPNAQQQREELQKREEARREEQERRKLEAQIQEFDAYEFYESVEGWASQPVPMPVRKTVQQTPLRRTIVMQQPLPVSRKELVDLRRLSSDCARLLYILRAIDQRGIECPYVHQVRRPTIEKALDKCDRLRVAEENYKNRPGIGARFAKLFNKGHLDAIKRDVEFFKSRLEAILMMCRHEEFAQDLMHIRRAVTYRTGLLLKPGEQPSVRQAGASRQGQGNGPRTLTPAPVRREQIGRSSAP